MDDKSLIATEEGQIGDQNSHLVPGHPIRFVCTFRFFGSSWLAGIYKFSQQGFLYLCACVKGAQHAEASAYGSANLMKVVWPLDVAQFQMCAAPVSLVSYLLDRRKRNHHVDVMTGQSRDAKVAHSNGVYVGGE